MIFTSSSIEKKDIPLPVQRPPLSHLILCTPTKSIPYFANSPTTSSVTLTYIDPSHSEFQTWFALPVA